jgi:hypothetical protein
MRAGRNQPYYYMCSGSPNRNLRIEGIGHPTPHVEAAAKKLLFYRCKTVANLVYSAMKSYFHRVSSTTIYEI